MALDSAREHLLAVLLDSPEEGIVGMSPDGTIQTWSRGAENIYGYTAQEMIGQSFRRLMPLPELPTVESDLNGAGQSDFRDGETTERLHKNGSRIVLKVEHRLVRDRQGKIESILERARVCERGATEAAGQAALSHVMGQLPLILWTTDRNLRITANWGTGLRFSDARPGELAGSMVCEFLECDERHATPVAEHYDALRGLSSRFEYRWKHSVLEIRLEPLRSASGEIIGCLGVGTDITDRKKSEEETLYQATHDALTGLANYREFMVKLELEVRRAERSHHSFTLLLLDLDELKKINDLQGHLAGNRALKRLAAVMKEHCRSTDLAARYGGDEFAVVLIDSDQGMTEHVAQRIEKGLRNDREKPPLSVSIGIGVYPDDGRTSAELIQAADRQLYRHKKARNSRSVSAT